MVVVPDRLLHRGDALEVVALGHLAQRHALRAAAAQRRWSATARDHHRLQILGLEARREQPPREVGREVVAVQLPLEPLAALGEEPHLAGDQLVEVRPSSPPRSR